MISVTFFFAFLCLCLNTSYGEIPVGTPNNCTLSAGPDCEVKANDIIEFDMSCNPTFKSSYDLLQLPKGSFLVYSDAKKIIIQIANIIINEEKVSYKQKCDKDNDDVDRSITYKKGGKELKLPGIDFTGQSIHFKQQETSINQDKTFTVEVGKWKKSTAIGLVCPYANLDEMKCFSEVIYTGDKSVPIKEAIPKATFDFMKSALVDKVIKNVESLVMFTGPEITDPNNASDEIFEFKCTCVVGTHTVTVIYKGTVAVPKIIENPDEIVIDGTDPDFKPDDKPVSSSLVAYFHKMFGLLTVFLYFYLIN